jgi:hypothetical protein
MPPALSELNRTHVRFGDAIHVRNPLLAELAAHVPDFHDFGRADYGGRISLAKSVGFISKSICLIFRFGGPPQMPFVTA